MRTFLEQLQIDISAGNELVVATIISSSGSTPRTSGSKMLIRRDGSIAGTIGGGKLEADVMAAAPAVFENKGCQFESFYLTGKDAASMDMICGGEIEVFLEYLAPSDESVTLFTTIRDYFVDGKPFYLVTQFVSNGSGDFVLARGLLADGAFVAGSLNESDELYSLLIDEKKEDYPAVIEYEDSKFFVESFAVSSTLYLLGAGHVAIATAALAAQVGFRIVVIDDRAEFANRERFPMADDVRVIASFDECIDPAEMNEKSYIVILTRGHMYDKTALACSLRSEAGYVGMIGSRRKSTLIFESLKSEGVTDETLSRVYTPVGVPIGAETPEEIAVSIVGELIKVRAGV